MNNIIFNQNINETNFLIFKRKNKVIVNEIVPFINDFMKITLHTTNDKIKDNEIDLPQFDGDKRTFDSYSKGLLSSFKEQFFLNSDIYNFRNEFFTERKSKKVEINKKAKNVTIKHIEIARRYSQFYVDFKFTVKVVINKELKDIETTFSCNFGQIKQDNSFDLYNNFVSKFNEKYNIQQYDESIKVYQNFLNFQNKIMAQYTEESDKFNKFCVNVENDTKFVY